MTTDFDFLQGDWDVANRRRADYLDEGSGWEEFPAVSRATRHFDGGANFDEIRFPDYTGLTVRLFDPETRRWSLYWGDSRRGGLFPPVEGAFVDGRGEFHGDDEHDGKPVRVRYLWSVTAADSAHWEQAFSLDGGETWITNWHMDFTRR
jgi:hypothetical protein